LRESVCSAYAPIALDALQVGAQAASRTLEGIIDRKLDS
jgi:hypothetical protein